MANAEKTHEDRMDAGYAALAVDPEYLAQQEARRKLRGLNQRRFNKGKMPNEDTNGNIIPGVWIVSVTTGEAWEQSHTRQIAACPTLEKAQEVYDAYCAALTTAEANEVEQYTSSSCSIDFIPSPAGKIAYHVFYQVETTRNEDNPNIREVESVQSSIYSEELVQKILNEGKDPLFAAIWSDRSLAVIQEYADVRPEEPIASSFFADLNLSSGYDPNDTVEYDSPYETFLTFDPKNVILEKQA